MDRRWTRPVQVRRVQVWADGRGRAGRDRRALAAIAACAVLPVLISVLLNTGSDTEDTPEAPPASGHWVYVPGRGIAVHVDGSGKRADTAVLVGSASAASPVLTDEHGAYLVDDDRIVQFDRDGVTGEVAGAGVAERPVPVEGAGSAYLVYRAAGLVTRLGPEPATVTAGGPLGAPVVTPNGQLWTYRADTRQPCLLTDDDTFSCHTPVPAGHTGALAVLDGRPGLVDLTAGTWRELGEPGAEPVELGVSLPANAGIAATSVSGRLAVLEPDKHRLLLIPPGGEATTVRLDDGGFAPPVSTGGAVAVVNTDTGVVSSFDASGRQRGEAAIPGGDVRLARGADGRGYADSTDGLLSVIVDTDGALTPVRTTTDSPPTYASPTPIPTTSLPPATVAVTTTETVPPAPETVTVEVTPTTSTPRAPSQAAEPDQDQDRPNRPSSTTTDRPDPPATTPTVDVLSAKATQPGRARLRIRVSGPGPVFCHVYVNSVERAATRCSDTMTVVAKGLAPNMTYDVYVLGTNKAGTGDPGRRAVLRT